MEDCKVFPQCMEKTPVSYLPKMFNLKHNNVIVQVDNLEAIINTSEKVFIEKISTCI